MKRVKRIIHLLIVCCILFSCSTDEIIKTNTPDTESATFTLTSGEARDLLLNFIGSELQTKSGKTPTLTTKNTLVYKVGSSQAGTRSGSSSEEEIPVYEFEIQEEGTTGFALVAGDKRISPVLAYVPEGSLNDTTYMEPLADFMRAIPGFLEESLDNSIFIPGPTEERPVDPGNKDSTNVFINGFNEYASCYLPTKWNQNYPYNSNVPLACSSIGWSYNGLAPIGCIPTALAQIMAYHRKPVNFDWNLLLKTPSMDLNTAQDRCDEIARLMILVAENASVKFNCSGSGATDFGAIICLDNLGFQQRVLNIDSGAIPINPCDDCLEEYQNDIIASIKSKRPCYFSGSRHAVVADAYGKKNYPVTVTVGTTQDIALMNSTYYHINYGWGGSNNGWFLVYNKYIRIKDGQSNSTFLSTNGLNIKSIIVDIH